MAAELTITFLKTKLELQGFLNYNNLFERSKGIWKCKQLILTH